MVMTYGGPELPGQLPKKENMQKSINELVNFF